MKIACSLALAACCGMLQAAADLTDALNPIYHLDFETTTDSTGASLTNTGTSSLITASKSGGYLNYDVTGSYAGNGNYAYNNKSNHIILTLNGALSWSDGFTVSMAVKAESLDTTAWHNILAVGNTNNHVRVQNPAADQFGLYGSGIGNAGTLGNVTHPELSKLSTTDFTLITLVYEVRDGGGYFTLYSDGAIVSQSTNPLSTSASGPQQITIGGNFTGNRYQPLLIDEVAIYDRALSQNDINSYLVDKPAGIIPEPSSAALGLLAFAGLLGRRRR